MKTWLLLIAASVIFLSSISSAQTVNIGGEAFVTKKVIVLNESQNWKKIEMVPGQTLSIQLEESSGFTWKVLDFDSKVLRELEPLFQIVSNAGEAERGMRVIGFDAMNIGKSGVRLGYVDSARKGNVAKGFNIEIDVKSPSDYSLEHSPDALKDGFLQSVQTRILKEEGSTLDKWEGEEDGNKAGYPVGYQDAINNLYMGYTAYEPPTSGNDAYRAGYAVGWDDGYRRGYSEGFHAK